MIDLKPEHLREVRRILDEQVSGLTVYAYGSRVNGKALKFSDLDLALLGPEPIGSRRINALKDAFSESDLPFMVDVVDLRAVTPEFRENIERNYGILQIPE